MDNAGSFYDSLPVSPMLPKPIEARRKTDSVFFYIFIGTFILWFAIGIYALSSGTAVQVMQQPRKLNWGNTLNKRQIRLYGNRYSDSYDTSPVDFDPVPPNTINYVEHYWAGFFVPMLLSTVLILGEIYLLRWYAGFVVWATIYFVFALFFIAGTIFVAIHFMNQNVPGMLITGCLIYLTAIIYAIVLYVVRKKIPLTIELIRESSKAIGDLPSTLFFPLIPLILQMFMFLFGASSFIALIVKINQSNSNNMDSNNNGPDYELLLVLTFVYGFSMLWVFFFVNGFINMVLAGTFGTWYWSNPKSSIRRNPMLHSMKIATKCHLGTLALGSLILALVEMIFMIIRAFCKRRIENSGCCCRCCCGFMLRFQTMLKDLLNYLNKIIYIMTMLHGTTFAESAKKTFKVLTSNIVQILVLKRITYLVLCIAQLIIVGISCGTGFAMFNAKSDNESSQIGVILALLAAVSVYITSFFINVFNTAIDTMFICYMEDREINDGSEEKPYYMSMNLANIFEKTDD